MILTDNLPNTYEESFKNKEFNTSAVTVWAEEDYFYLEPNYSKSLIPTVLKINRKVGTIQEIQTKLFSRPNKATPFYFSFFIGIVNLNGKKIIMLSEEVLLVCTISKRDIFKITKPIFLFYNPLDKKSLSDDEAQILVNLVIIYEQGMYFSYAYNLTEPLHHIKKLTQNEISTSFNWAQSLQNELISCDSMWSIPVIQGFVNKIELYINAQKLKMILISRRSIKYGGPWQYTTGLSNEGNSSNFVETQQIFCVNDFLFSFVQVRGSVPLFWQQIFSYGMPSKTSFSKSVEQNEEAFRLHITNMLRNREYDTVVLLNLLSKESSSQKKLIQNYEYLIRKTDKQKSLTLTPNRAPVNKEEISLHYYFYDLHSHCSNKNYSPFNKFITNQLQRALQACSFTAVRIKQDKTYEILSIQKGLIRSNCGTCIDRTNIAQSRIAAYQLVHILSHSNLNINTFSKTLEFVDSPEAFGTLYRNLWADNGDNISQQYTGTGSTESYAIRKGKLSYLTTIDHGLTSLVRAVRNIRQEDEQKNKTVLFLLKNFKSRAGKEKKQVASSQNDKSKGVPNHAGSEQLIELSNKNKQINLLDDSIETKQEIICFRLIACKQPQQ